MLRLPRFEYVRPRSYKEAVEAVAERKGAMLVAGGTDLLPNLKRRQFDAPVLVSLNSVPTRPTIGEVDGGFEISAASTLDHVANDSSVRDRFRALSQACGSVSTPHIQSMGTLGGNLMVDPRCNYYNQTFFWRKAIGFCMKRDGDICLVARSSPRCWAVSSSDSAPVALALQAEVVLLGTDGERRIQARDLYRDDGIDYTTKKREEVILKMVMPRSKNRITSSYWKLRRRGSFDFPILGVAVALEWDDGEIREARGALGAVGSLPVDITTFLKPLNGERPTDELIAEVAEAADKRSRPLDNTDLSHYWRKRMTRVYIERAIREAAGLEPLAGRLTALHGTAPASP